MAEQKKRKGLWWKILLALVVLSLGYCMFAGGGFQSMTIDGPKPPESEYPKYGLDYNGMQDGTVPIGTKVTYMGRVQNRITDRVIVIAIDKGMLFRQGRPIIGVYKGEKTNKARGDFITFGGRFIGIKEGWPVIQLDY